MKNKKTIISILVLLLAMTIAVGCSCEEGLKDMPVVPHVSKEVTSDQPLDGEEELICMSEEDFIENVKHGHPVTEDLEYYYKSINLTEDAELYTIEAKKNYVALKYRIIKDKKLYEETGSGYEEIYFFTYRNEEPVAKEKLAQECEESDGLELNIQGKYYTIVDKQYNMISTYWNEDEKTVCYMTMENKYLNDVEKFAQTEKVEIK